MLQACSHVLPIYKILSKSDAADIDMQTKHCYGVSVEHMDVCLRTIFGQYVQVSSFFHSSPLHQELTCVSQRAPKAAVPPHNPTDVRLVGVNLICGGRYCTHNTS